MDFGFCDTIIGRIGVVGRENFITEVLFDFEIQKAEQHKSQIVSEALTHRGKQMSDEIPMYWIPVACIRKIFGGIWIAEVIK